MSLALDQAPAVVSLTVFRKRAEHSRASSGGAAVLGASPVSAGSLGVLRAAVAGGR